MSVRPSSDPFLSLHQCQPSSTTLASGSPMALPACYSGEAAKCNGFLLQCTLYFEMQPQRFPTERSKTAFITSLLSGRALDWADALWQAENPIIGSLTSFVKHFKEVFGKATGKLSPSDELYRLRQGSSSVSDYTLRFRTVATLSGWNEPALCSAYRQGLNIGIRQQLVIFDDAIGLEALMQKTVQIAQRLSACVPESHGQLAASPNPDKILPTPEPMQTDSYHLSATERIRRVSQGLCLYCGENGHALNSCPVRPPRPFVSIMQVFPDVISMSQLSVRLLIKNSIFTVKALVDSGASGNFISFNTLKDLNLPALPQEPQYRINTIRGEPLGPGRIKHRSPVCQLRIGNFHSEEISFLVLEGATVDIVLGRPWLVKHSPIVDWTRCDILRWKLQRFLGFANFYRRFINQFSLLSATLTNLLKDKPKTLTWTPSASQAFASLKSAFCTAPALVLPDPQEPFIVEVDASTIGAGAVLSQYSGEPPKLHPCAFFSRKFSPAEQNYDIGNRELLAIKLALEEWRHWLEGARHPFSVITDHRNLEYIREAKRLNPRQARWALFSRFRFTITYRPGHKNVKADALSRLHQPDLPTTSDPILPPEHFLCPIIWDLDRQLQEATSLEPVPPGGPEDKVYVPSSMRSALLDSVHSSPGSGHPGSKRTLSLLRSRFWWPQMAREVSQHVHACSVCAMTNTPRQLPCGKLVPLPIPTRPWSHIGIDFVTDLPSSNNYTCILVIVDRFSKSCKFIPLSCLPTAMETAEALLHSIFRYYGLPEDIVSDRGPQFISRVWHAFFRNLQISVSLSSGYHPQTNGQTERKIQELGRYLRAYCSSNQHDWSRYLPWAEYAQNSLRQSTTGLTPFQCVLGYQPALFPWSGEPSNVPAVDHWFRESERVWDSAHVHLQHAVRSHKIFADVRRRPAPTFQPGELVWLSTKDIRLRLPCKKLSPRYIGPFPIQRQLNPVTYQLQLPSHYRIHPAFHVSLLKPATNPPLPPSTESDGTEVPPPPEILEDPSIYRVKEILDSRRRGGQIEYLIDWEGYGPEERSWIPRKDILDPTLLSEFHQQHPERPAPRPRGRPRHHFRASGAA
ncbi:hypothetical protein M9458_037843, partial [Cirrhinus mrigala]